MTQTQKKTKPLIEGPLVLVFAFLLVSLIFGFFILRAYYLGYVGGLTSLELKDGSQKKIPLDHELFFKNRPAPITDFLNSDKTLLIFWATWCEPCIEEIKSMPAKIKAIEAKGYRLVFINLDNPKNQKTVESFISNNGFETAFDPNGELLSLLEISTLPTSLVVDKSGKITKVLLGILDEKEL
ncbi:MAG: TlpA disulfide reductase family protein [bacterium]